MKETSNNRGFFGIGVYEPKFDENIGTLWRHAYLYNASFVFTIGARYKKQPTETSKSTRHIPLYYYETFKHFRDSIPINAELLAIELADNSQCLSTFEHPDNAVYLLGSEGFGIPVEILPECESVIQIYAPKPQSMNVSTAGTIIMYDRAIKQRK
jgi:tRNA(Leu) C34 or U34 (ribose-2'-O)-methylase TrmL